MDISKSYIEAVRSIKAAILRSQYSAVASVNKGQLSLYYGIGRYVSENSRKGFWGKGAIEQISSMLQKELPGLRGFSTRNIKNMRQFYGEWEQVINRQPVTADLELDEREEDINERVIEKAIVANVKRFIMTFGRDFSFIGNQYRIEVAGEEMFIDLLFFNRELNSLVAVELKSGKFRTSYLGQLNTYLSALDSCVRKPHENPSIGIILCREMNHTFVEFAVRDYNKPMGVATYRASEDMPERLRKALPDIEDLKKLL